MPRLHRKESFDSPHHRQADRHEKGRGEKDLKQASSVTPIWGLLIPDLAGPTTELIDLADIVVLLPILFRRVGTHYAHALHHGHFGTVWLGLCAIGDRQRNTGIVICRIEAGYQIKRDEALHNHHHLLDRSHSQSVAARMIVTGTMTRFSSAARLIYAELGFLPALAAL
jgi:hypothetical protein